VLSVSSGLASFDGSWSAVSSELSATGDKTGESAVGSTVVLEDTNPSIGSWVCWELKSSCDSEGLTRKESKTEGEYETAPDRRICSSSIISLALACSAAMTACSSS
jgi:hypothetical protein